MQTLYGAGITSAILVSDKVGAFPADIARLLMEKRTRKQARKTYGIIGNKIKLDVITYETYVHYYTKLVNMEEGINIVDRYLSIVKELSVKQAADFTKKLPLELRRELTKYEEFHIVLDSMRRQGIPVNIKKPADVRKGLTDEEFMRAIGKRQAKAKKVSAQIIVPEVDEKQAVADKKSGSGKTKTDKSVATGLTAEAEENVFFQEQEEKENSSTEINASENNAVREVSPVEKKPTSIKNELPKQTVKKKETSKPIKRDMSKKEKKNGIRWKYILITFFAGLIVLGLWYVLLMYL